jgi:hypothetical protein
LFCLFPHPPLFKAMGEIGFNGGRIMKFSLKALIDVATVV